MKMHIKVILTIFAHNEAIGTFWKAEFNTYQPQKYRNDFYFN